VRIVDRGALGAIERRAPSYGPHFHHGTLNAVFLPAVIAYNRTAPSMQDETKLQRIAQAMSLASADEVWPAIRAMTATLGLPLGLGELGVTRDMFPR
jgi:alcohol dehydrogenase class IV